MKLLEILQGKWLGHPLHPAIVHVPLGLWTFACILDVIVWLGGDSVVLPRLAFYSVLIGLIGALLAVPPGVADWTPIKKEKPAWKLGLYHLLLNLLATILWTVNFGLRFETLETGVGITVPVLVTSLVATLLVFAGGYIGSLMVFDQGTSVARQSKDKWRSRAQRAGSNIPDKK